MARMASVTSTMRARATATGMKATSSVAASGMSRARSLANSVPVCASTVRGSGFCLVDSTAALGSVRSRLAVRGVMSFECASFSLVDAAARGSFSTAGPAAAGGWAGFSSASSPASAPAGATLADRGLDWRFAFAGDASAEKVTRASAACSSSSWSASSVAPAPKRGLPLWRPAGASASFSSSILSASGFDSSKDAGDPPCAPRCSSSTSRGGAADSLVTSATAELIL
mmetsp:Transcript_13512/g.43168  ORF Transcript_13512/g.43168 Transcript_13512/m.43168 type:complete len:228 (-) Transcript_13512:112-795(-)